VTNLFFDYLVYYYYSPCQASEGVLM
jgi:hypothetical protein